MRRIARERKADGHERTSGALVTRRSSGLSSALREVRDHACERAIRTWWARVVQTPCMQEFLILGPLEVRSEEGPIALGGLRQRALLAALLLRAGRVVPTEQLVDEL